MQLDQLATKLGASSPEELRDLWSAYRGGGGVDGEGFLAWLHARDHIDTRVFCEVLASGPLQVDVSTAWSASWGGGGSEVPDDAPRERYRPLGTVGEGAMGEVLVVADRVLHRKVALKRLKPDAMGHGDAVARFMQEAQVTAQLDHPNVVPVYDVGDDTAEVPAYSMKLVHGLTLGQLLDEARERGPRAEPPHDLPSRLEVFLKVCDAMAYAHSRGVIHRDLKPANIMVGAFGEVYVMDWGIARLVAEPDPTEEGLAIGTPSYMSPEQAIGHNEGLDVASDQYALGLILYEVATLRRAIEGKGASLVFRAQAGERGPAVDVRGRRLSPDLVAVLDRAMEFEPEDRYPDVEGFAEDVRAVLRGEPPSVRPDNLPRRARRLLARHVVALVVSGLSLLLLAALAVVLVLAVMQVRLYAAAVREDKLTHAMGVVGDRAAAGDAYFLELEGLLEGIADASAQLLLHAAPDAQPLYFNADYEPDGVGPPDLVTVSRYPTPVSFGWPVFKVAPGVDRDAVRPRLERLVLLRHHLRETFLRSHAEEAALLSDPEVTALLGESGVPIIWSYVAIAEGVHMSYPGHGGYPDAYDPRERPWYQLAEASRGPTWGSPYIDVNGLGLILPCVMAIRDDDAVVAVAGVEVTFDRVIDTLLSYPQLPGVRRALLVDEQGRVVVSSSQQGAEFDAGLHENQGLDLEPVPWPEVREAIVQGHSGHHELGGDLILVERLDALGWSVVVEGDAGEMIGLL